MTGREMAGHLLAGVLLGVVIFAPPFVVAWTYFR